MLLYCYSSIVNTRVICVLEENNDFDNGITSLGKKCATEPKYALKKKKKKKKCEQINKKINLVSQK